MVPTTIYCLSFIEKCLMAESGPVMALMALMAYGLWQDKCDYYWYPVKEHKKTNSPVLLSPH